MSIGERITADKRYIKCPPAASFFWLDNFSVDAGTAHIVHSNLSTLSERNLRQVCTLIGPGAIVGYDPTKDENGYVNNRLVDAFYPTEPTDPNFAVLQIAWVAGYDCMVAGPLPAVPFELTADPPGYRPRKIVGRLTGQKGTGGGSIRFVAAVCQGASPPSLRLPLVYDAGASHSTSGAAITYDFTLTVPITRPTRELHCRPNGLAADATNRVMDLYLWVGWFSSNPSTVLTAKDLVYTLSAWESI